MEAPSDRQPDPSENPPQDPSQGSPPGGSPDGSTTRYMHALFGESETERPGDRIGPYTLVSRIGSGGFGTVWLAERREPMLQRVAIKLISGQSYGRDAVERFNQERQALAVMDHPNIARVFDGGTTAAGRPYFVMEYVPGKPLTQYCDDERLPIRERLGLFITVCDAVQHAHHKGIIHRDIKPGNVLVEKVDGRPVAKVIDFGLAKATEKAGFGPLSQSIAGGFLGTPEYMSPEQVDGNSDIDSRTDVYSLGVVLYAILTGRLPFEPAALRERGIEEIRRVIREEDPPTPASQFMSLDEESSTIAGWRRQSPASLARELRRELEWIPMMAMRKERDRRYGSPSEMADDLRRYLDGSALRAGPESRAYRARKFVARNRVLVGATAAVIAALTTGLALAGWQWGRAERFAESERLRADELKRVSDFQSQMLQDIDPWKAGTELREDLLARYGGEIAGWSLDEQARAARLGALRAELQSVNATDAASAMIDRTILLPALKAVDERFADSPLLQAKLSMSIAVVYSRIGIAQKALPLQERSLAIRRRELGDDHPDTLESLNSVGLARLEVGDFEGAERSLVDAVDESMRTMGLRDERTLTVLDNLASLRVEQGRLADAEQTVREVLQAATEIYGLDSAKTLVFLNNLGYVLQRMNRLPEAEACHRDTLERRRRLLGEDHPQTISSFNNLGIVIQGQGRLAEAEPYYAGALERCKRVRGELHPETLTSTNNMGMLLVSMGRLDEAEVYFRDALAKRVEALGPDHPETLTSHNNMGHLFRKRNQPEQAEPFFREALERCGARSAASHPYRIVYSMNLADVLLKQGKHGAAEEVLARAEAGARSGFAQGERSSLPGLLALLGRARVGMGFDPARFRSAEANLLESYPLSVEVYGESNPNTAFCTRALVDLYTDWHAAEPGQGHGAKAEEWKARLPPSK